MTDSQKNISKLKNMVDFGHLKKPFDSTSLKKTYLTK